MQKEVYATKLTRGGFQRRSSVASHVFVTTPYIAVKLLLQDYHVVSLSFVRIRFQLFCFATFDITAAIKNNAVVHPTVDSVVYNGSLCEPWQPI
jgi:hypothetical protein